MVVALAALALQAAVLLARSLDFVPAGPVWDALCQAPLCLALGELAMRSRRGDAAPHFTLVVAAALVAGWAVGRAAS